METAIYSIYYSDNPLQAWEDFLTLEEKKQLYVKADPEIIDILPTGEIYVTQLEYRKKLTEVFGVGGWRLIPCSPWFEDINCRRQMWALEVRGHIISYAWGEDETYRTEIKEGDTIRNSPSFAAPEVAKSNALMRLAKDLLLFHNLWDRDFIREFKEKYCEKVPTPNRKTGRMEDYWKKNGSASHTGDNDVKSSPVSHSNESPFSPNTPTEAILQEFNVPGSNNKKNGRALFVVGEDKLETTFFNLPQGASSYEELSKYVGRKITFTYKQNGRWANLLTVQFLEKEVADLMLLKKEIKSLIEGKGMDEVVILQKWGKTTVEDITSIEEAGHIAYELEQSWKK